MSSSESQQSPIMPPVIKIVVTALISCLMPTIGVLVMTVVLAKSKFDFGFGPDPKQVAAAIVADEHFPDLSQVTPEQWEWVDAVGVSIRGKPRPAVRPPPRRLPCWAVGPSIATAEPFRLDAIREYGRRP